MNTLLILSVCCEMAMQHAYTDIAVEPFSLSRFRKMSDEREAKSHEAEVIMTRMKQSTHHQQLTELQTLKDTISKSYSCHPKTQAKHSN